MIVVSNKLLLGALALLLPMPALAQVRLEADAYARARARCGYQFQEQAQQRCSGRNDSCTAPLLRQQQVCLRQAEQRYVRDLRRQMRQGVLR